jgi:hypothetical protein
MQFNLVPHPATPPSDPLFKVWVNVEYSAAFSATATTNIWFGIGAPASRFVIPEAAEAPARAEDLWQTTCFEAFLRVPGADAYREWNFSPSGDWAAYDFAAHREGRTDADVAPPYVRIEDNLIWWTLGATIALDADTNWALGLSAILEEKDGTKSYWALAHPLGDKPDFPDPVCFAAHLP